MANYEIFNLKRAIAEYLGRKETYIDWTTEVVVDIATEQILSWNVLNVTQPTIEELKTNWEVKQLQYYKKDQHSRVKAQFMALQAQLNDGCKTSVLDIHGNPIYMQVRRNDKENDIQNITSLIYYMDRKNITETQIRDKDDNMHLLTYEQIQQLLEDMIGFGLAIFQAKWSADRDINNATSIPEVLAINIDNYYST